MGKRVMSMDVSRKRRKGRPKRRYGLLMHVLTEKVLVGEEGHDQANWRGLVRNIKVGNDVGPIIVIKKTQILDVKGCLEPTKAKVWPT